MKKILFLLSVVRARMQYNRGLYLIIIASFGAGLILPAFCISNILFLQKNLESEMYLNMERTIEVDYFVYDSKPDWDKWAERNKIEYMSTSCMYEKLIPEMGNKSMNVLEIDDNYFLYNKIEVGKGNVFDDNKSCFIHEKIAQEYSLELKDVLTIGNHTYQICGFIKDLHLKGYIILPLERELSIDVNKQYLSYFTLEDEVDLQSFINDIEICDDIKINAIKTGQENFEGTLNSVQVWIVSRVVIAVVSVIFAAVNNTFVLYGLFLNSRRSIGIHCAIGANKKHIIFMFTIEVLIIVILAVIIVFTLLRPLAFMLEMQEEILINRYLIGILFLISILIAIGMLTILALLTRRKTLYRSMVGE